MCADGGSFLNGQMYDTTPWREDKEDCDKPNCIKIPYNKTFRDLLCIIPIQILAYELSLSRGLNPDMPRNLAKVVTVE